MMAETRRPPPPPSRAPGAETVTVTIDGQTAPGPQGDQPARGLQRRSAPTSASSATTPGCRSPAVCRQCLVDVKGQPKPVPSCYTPVADKMEVIDQLAARARRAPADAGVHARQPPDRLPDLRQGGRVHAAEALLRLGRQARAQRRHQGPQGQGRRPRPAHRARPGALHPVHALHPRLRRGGQDAPARDGPARRSRGADHRARPPARQPLLAQHRRRLPGGRAHLEGFPLRDARLGAVHRRRRCAPAAPPAATSRSTTRAARSIAWCRARTRPSTSTGCATRGASPTSRVHAERLAAPRSGGVPVEWDKALDDAGHAAARRRSTPAPARSAWCSTPSRPTRISTRSPGWPSITWASARPTSPAATRAGSDDILVSADKNPNTAGADGDRRGPAAERCWTSPTTSSRAPSRAAGAGHATACSATDARRRRCRSTSSGAGGRRHAPATP